MDEELKIPEGAEPEGIKKPVTQRKNKSEAFAELMQRKGIRQATAEKEALAKQSNLEEEIIPEIEKIKKTERLDKASFYGGRESEYIDKEVTDAELEKIRANSDGKGKKIMKNILIGTGIILLIGALAGGGFVYYQFRQNQTAVPADEAEAYAAKISRFAALPNEKPTVGTVTDAATLKNDPFFSAAQNGDKVLLFSGAKKAYLYRPHENKLIEVMALFESQSVALPIVTDKGAAGKGQPHEKPAAETQEVAASPPQKESVKVAVYNGTAIRGLAKSIGDQASKIEGISVSEITNAKGNFAKTSIIDLTGNNQPFLQNIKASIGGEISTNMPDGEIKPEADILIIGGQDRQK